MSKKIDSIKMDFAALAERWLVSIAQGLKESTLTHYDYTLHRYILPVFGKLKLSSIDEQRLEHGMLEVIAPQDGSHKPLGASSARECLTMLRRICKYAAHLRLMRPVEVMIKLPQFEQDQTKPFSTQEQKTVQSFVLSHPTPRKVGLLLQMQLGLRIGEVCGLQWSDFDLEADVLTIRRTVSRIYCREGHTKVVIQTPKTRSSGRDIPLPKELVALLRQLRLDFRHLRGLRGDGFVYRVGLLARQRPALGLFVRNVRAAAQPRDRRVGFILVAEKFLDRLDFLREQVIALLERHVDIRAALLDLHREAAQPVVNRNISDDGGERRASGYHVRLHSEIVLLRRPQSAARRHNYTTGPA